MNCFLDLDVVNLAHSFGLLRLPKMPELKDRDLSGFRKSKINTADIPFKDAKLEKARREKRKLRQQQAEEVKNRKLQKSKPKQQTEDSKVVDDENNVSSATKIDRKRFKDDNETMLEDYKNLKKFKKGKISEKEFDNVLMNV